jgi:hypothetical protein
MMAQVHELPQRTANTRPLFPAGETPPGFLFRGNGYQSSSTNPARLAVLAAMGNHGRFIIYRGK